MFKKTQCSRYSRAPFLELTFQAYTHHTGHVYLTKTLGLKSTPYIHRLIGSFDWRIS